MDVASHAVVVDGDELWGDRLEPAGGGLDPRLLVLFEGGDLQVESLEGERSGSFGVGHDGGDRVGVAVGRLIGLKEKRNRMERCCSE